MLDVTKIRKDFPQFKGDLVYLDNGGTTFKPNQVIQKEVEYYTEYCANAHSDDFVLAQRVTKEVEEARQIVADFINANKEEIVFTSGDTGSMNMLAYSLMDTLEEGDEILLTLAEHASNVLPWYKICKYKKCVVKFIPLNEDGSFSFENLEKTITEKTKVISLAQVSNVLGYVLDVKKVCEIAHKHNILVVVDGAQSVPHIKTDVKDMDCDFLVFSGHKMCGPTGIGVLYGKKELLDKLDPPFTGGAMNGRFDTKGNYTLVRTPYKFEAGTQNFAGIVGLGEACKYLQNIGMENISKYEEELKHYAIQELSKVEGITVYNSKSSTGIVAFNFNNVFAQDAATLFNSYNICVRSGQHCAKVLQDQIKTYATVRASLYFYNTKEDIDKLVEVCKKGDEYLDVYFK